MKIALLDAGKTRSVLIILPIQSSPWYNASHPSGGDGELWDYRVAMLDILYYDEDA